MFCVQIYLHFYLVQHPGYGIFDQCVVTAIGRDFVNIYCPRFGIEERIFVFSSPLYELVRCVARDFSFFVVLHRNQRLAAPPYPTMTSGSGLQHCRFVVAGWW